MAWQDKTGDGVQLERETASADLLTSEPFSGDRWAPGFETAGSRSTGESPRRFNVLPTKKTSSPERQVPIRAVQRRRRYLRLALEELERAEDAGQDVILKNNCLAQVRDHLQELWESLESDSQSDAFEEMINVLQIAFCDENVDALTSHQVDALKVVLVELEQDPEIDDAAANELTRELIRGGIDVFREIG